MTIAEALEEALRHAQRVHQSPAAAYLAGLRAGVAAAKEAAIRRAQAEKKTAGWASLAALTVELVAIEQVIEEAQR